MQIFKISRVFMPRANLLYQQVNPVIAKIFVQEVTSLLLKFLKLKRGNFYIRNGYISESPSK